MYPPCFLPFYWSPWLWSCETVPLSTSLSLCDILQLPHWKKRNLASLRSVAFLAWPGWSPSLGSFLLSLPPWKTEKKISIWRWLCSSRRRTEGELWGAVRDFLTSSGVCKGNSEEDLTTIARHWDPDGVCACPENYCPRCLSSFVPSEVWRDNVSPVAIT